MIIDAHAHVFPLVAGRIGAGITRGIANGRVSVGDREMQAFPPSFTEVSHTVDMLIEEMDAVGVDRAVLLQGPFYGECNDFAARAVRSYPDRLIAAAYLDPHSAELRESFERIIADASFSAVKVEFSEATGLYGIHPGARLDDPSISWLWSKIERNDLALVLDLGAVGSASYQTDAVRAIALRHPDLKIVICHLAQPVPAAEADPCLWRLWEEQIDLGRLSNVWFDTASLFTCVFTEGYPFPNAARYLRIAIDRIGPERIVWGTDIPGLFIHATYQQMVDLAKMHTEFLSADAQALVLGENALRVYSRAVD